MWELGRTLEWENTANSFQMLETVKWGKGDFTTRTLLSSPFELFFTRIFWTFWSGPSDQHTLTLVIKNRVTVLSLYLQLHSARNRRRVLFLKTVTHIQTLTAGTCDAAALESVIGARNKSCAENDIHYSSAAQCRSRYRDDREERRRSCRERWWHRDEQEGSSRTRTGGSVNANAHFLSYFPPFNILTATVLQVESLSIPKAEASTTFPNAPWPRVLPGKRRRYWMSFLSLGLVSLWVFNQRNARPVFFSREFMAHLRLDDSSGHWWVMIVHNSCSEGWQLGHAPRRGRVYSQHEALLRWTVDL